MVQKGVYPWDHMGIFDEFQETALKLPTVFYSALNGENLSADDYKHVQDYGARLIPLPTLLGMLC